MKVKFIAALTAAALSGALLPKSSAASVVPMDYNSDSYVNSLDMVAARRSGASAAAAFCVWLEKTACDA